MDRSFLETAATARSGDRVALSAQFGESLPRLVAFIRLQAKGALLEQESALDRLDAAMAEIPARQREAIALRRIGGLSYPEAAEIMGRSESAVRGLVARGLTRLASELGNG